MDEVWNACHVFSISRLLLWPWEWTWDFHTICGNILNDEGDPEGWPHTHTCRKYTGEGKFTFWYNRRVSVITPSCQGTAGKQGLLKLYMTYEDTTAYINITFLLHLQKYVRTTGFYKEGVYGLSVSEILLCEIIFWSTILNTVGFLATVFAFCRF
jgi:hypothetical protein